tara:strand:- start:487 stop:981 length:495 start_codon:yes stop_codon:yes gene_type:complete
MFRIIGAYVDNLNNNIVHFLSAIIVIILTVYLVKSIQFILKATVEPPNKNYHVVLELIYSVILGLGVWLAVLEITSYELLSKILQAFMVGFGFSIQSPILSFVSGLIMWQNNDIRIGDRIEVNKISGVVYKITLLRTYLKTDENQNDYIVYNNQLVNNIVKRIR